LYKKNLIDVLFIQPNIEDFYITKQRLFPLGLWILSSYLKNKEVSVEIFDCLKNSKKKQIPFPKNLSYLKKYYNKEKNNPINLFNHYYHFGIDSNIMIDYIRHVNPKVIAIASNFTTYNKQVFSIAEKIKENFNNIPIIVGGHNSIIMYKDFILSGFVDIVFLDFNPANFYKLIKNIIQKKDYNSIPLIAYKNKNEVVLNKNTSDNILDFDMPSIELINFDDYKIGKYNAVSLIKKFGCSYNCSFCTSNKLYYKSYKFDDNKIIDLMWNLYTKKNVRAFNFEDDDFVSNKKDTITFLSNINKKFGNKIRLYFMNGLNYKKLDSDIIDALTKAGLKNLNLAAVSFNENDYSLLNRNFVQSKLFDIIKYSRKNDMLVTVYLIVPLPNQTIDDLKIFMYKLNKYNVIIGISSLYLYPNSEMYNEYKSVVKNIPFSLMRGSTIPIENENIKRTDIINLLCLARELNKKVIT
jgi:radical SAM superfamily enzyme YgiQ (UPF0313 family)